MSITPPSPEDAQTPQTPDSSETLKSSGAIAHRRSRWGRNILWAVGALVVALLVVNVVSVSVNNARKSKVDVQELRDPLVQFVIDTAGQFPDKKWIPNSVAEIEKCNTADTRSYYHYMQWAPRGTDPSQDAQKIAKYWQGLGYKVSITDQDTTYPVVYATGSGDQVATRASFDTTGAGTGSEAVPRYVIGASSKCGNGNALHIKNEEDKQRCSGKPLFGDEGVIQQPDPMRTYLKGLPTEKQKEYFDIHDPCGY